MYVDVDNELEFQVRTNLLKPALSNASVGSERRWSSAHIAPT